MKHIIWILWPAFIAAAITEIVFFALIDPKQFYFFGETVEFSTLGSYSIGFFIFWLICASSSLISRFMLPADVKNVLQGHVAKREVSRP